MWQSFTPQDMADIIWNFASLGAKKKKEWQYKLQSFDGSLVSWDHFQCVLHAGPPHFETKTIWYSAFRDQVFPSHPVV